MEKLEHRAETAESKLSKISTQNSSLEAESAFLRTRAQTLEGDLTRARAESGIKVAEYKRQASHGAESSAEIFQRQLAEKEAELETLTARYARVIKYAYPDPGFPDTTKYLAKRDFFKKKIWQKIFKI
mgnify:CR=1 FL=1